MAVKLTEERIRRAVKNADRRYYDMIADYVREQRAEAASRKGKRTMEKRENKRKIGKIAIGAAITAAVLGAGGIAAAVAMRGSQGGNIFDRGSSNEPAVVSVQEQPEALRLTDDTRTAAPYHISRERYRIYDMAWFAETSDGLYYMQDACELNYDPDNTESFPQTTQNEHSCYYYQDKETGECVPLCARANCLHDGNPYCVASTKAYAPGRFISYDDQLYMITQPLNEDGSWGGGPLVLRYANDGTRIEELMRFSFPYETYAARVVDVILYRGFLFASVGLDASNYDIAGSPHRRGSAIVCYELATGKGSILAINMPEPNESRDCGSYGMIAGYGDSLILGSVKQLDLHSFEIKTLTQVMDTNNANIQFGKDACFVLDSDINGTKLMRLDLLTGEETRLDRTGIKGYPDWNDYSVNDDYLLFISTPAVGKDPNFVLYLCDYDCHVVQTVTAPDFMESQTDSFLRGDYLYVMQGNSERLVTHTQLENGEYETQWRSDIETMDPNDYLYRIRVSDLLAGKGSASEDWEKFLQVTDITLKAAHIDDNMQIIYH